jgi:hypothetical protein
LQLDNPAVTYRGYADAILNHATSTYNYLGADPIDNVVWVNDTTGGVIRQGSTATDWATQAAVTWSTAKGYPTNVTFAACVKMLRFKGKIYMLAKDTSDNLYKVWGADPASGSTAYSWSSPLKAMLSTVATGFHTAFSADDSYLYLAEYGDPTGGPSAWRSSDGVAWELIYGADASLRHIHCIKPDPYNPGHVWMTCGDGIAKPIQKSTDYGLTWSVITSSPLWQAVQISFTKNRVYLAGDSQQGVVFSVDKKTNTPGFVSVGLLKNIAVPSPAALTDAFYGNAWVGVVDPDTGIFYSSANDSSAGGNTAGIFVTIGHGRQPVLLDKLANINSPVDIFGGMVWIGKYKRPLLKY